MEKILWIVLGHCVLDYPLQSDFIALNKGKSNFILLIHSLIYGLGMALILKILGVFAIWKAAILVVSHFIIDYIKSHAEDKSKAMTTHLYADQIAHNIINIVLLFT